jgi:DNA-binding response OmpR family regulator
MRVLLVEDDSRLSAILRRTLEEEGYPCDVVEDGRDAVFQAATVDYDLLLLDVMIPGIDGFEVARRVRGNGAQTPILMLTARDAVPDRVQGLDAGADDYLVKPFAVSELLARVRALVRRSQMTPEDNALVFEDLKLDLRSREATRGDQTIELTSREFALLETLMRHPGQVLTRAQLLDQVWGLDAPVESNVVETYIHYLREKVDRGFDRRLIRTVRGAGYCLRPH